MRYIWEVLSHGWLAWLMALALAAWAEEADLNRYGRHKRVIGYVLIAGATVLAVLGVRQ